VREKGNLQNDAGDKYWQVEIADVVLALRGQNGDGHDRGKEES
jgi:hypothetical protein